MRLEWDDTDCGFQNTENRRQFYSWILPDPENNDRKRLSSDGDVRTLSKLHEGDAKDLIGKMDRHELTVEEAKAKYEVRNISENDWEGPVNDALEKLRNIPAGAIMEAPEELVEKLERVRELIEEYMTMMSR